MLTFELRFPLGVYYALSGEQRRDGPTRPEWPPSSVRLVGALLAAAHDVPSDDVAADREVLDQMCTAAPPTVHAPTALPCAEQRQKLSAEPDLKLAAELHGASRWAPRNPSLSELKELSPRVIGRTRTEVEKGGIAVGDLPVLMTWPSLQLDQAQMVRLRGMASNVAWLGTSRSPVIVNVHGEGQSEGHDGFTTWAPLPWSTDAADAQLRVPTTDLLTRFDVAYDARRSAQGRIEPSGHQRPAYGGRFAPYAVRDRATRRATWEPNHWGSTVIVALDDENDLRPRAPATYLAARAFRTALLDAFAERGEQHDAPAVLHGHGEVPHLAIVPLPFVGHERADGRVLGFMLVFPHRKRLPDVAAQRRTVETALAPFLSHAPQRRFIAVPGAAPLYLRQPDPRSSQPWTLSPARYTQAASTWVTVTPAVHSRWRKSSGPDAISQQVLDDCTHVGLPAPKAIEVLRGPAVRGGAHRLVPAREVRDEWRRPLQGPTSHLRLSFPEPVRGPILLGRARHFGVGLCVPDERGESTR